MANTGVGKQWLYRLAGWAAWLVAGGYEQLRPTEVQAQQTIVACGVQEDVQVLPTIEYLPPPAEPAPRCRAEPPVLRESASIASKQAPASAGLERGQPGTPPTSSPATGPQKADVNNAKLPISLDAVLRLAQDQNGQVGVAREKLQEAFVDEELAAKRWLPDLYFGTSYYRHEGGIQDFDGRLIHSSFGSLFAGVELRGKLDLRDAVFQKIDAARKVWQQKGEVSKLTSETLLDASTTYVDLLAARSGSLIARDIEDKMRVLAKRAGDLAQVEKGTQVEVARIQSEITAQQQITRKLREGERGAAAKLIYVLGLDPAVELVPLEKTLAAFALVDTQASLDELVAKARENGPGVRELEGLLALIDESAAKSRGMGQFIPVVEVNMAEGLFGAGPGSRTDWDNRWDLCVHARWNLTEFLNARQRQHLADSKIQQAHLSYHDLRAKLVLGVREAYEASLSGAEQVRLADQQVKHAFEAYKLSDERLQNNLKGASPSEVLLSIRALAGAHLNRINAIRDHDKAQLRLMVLLGVTDQHQSKE